jgi:hypothetical protein
MKKQLIILLLLFTAVPGLMAQVQSYQLKKGDVYEVSQDIDATIDMEVMGSSMQNKQKANNIDVIEVLSATGGVYEMKFTSKRRKVTVSSPMGGDMVMDSEGTNSTDMMLKAMVNKSFTFIMDQFGNVQGFDGLEEVRESIKTDLAAIGITAGPQLEQVLDAYAEEVLTGSIASQFGFYAGDSSNEWTKNYKVVANGMPVKLNVKHWYDSDNTILAEGQMDISGEMQQMGMAMTSSLKGTQNTIYDLAPSGMPAQVQTKQEAEGAMTAQGMDMPMKLSSITITKYTKQ